MGSRAKRPRSIDDACFLAWREAGELCVGELHASNAAWSRAGGAAAAAASASAAFALVFQLRRRGGAWSFEGGNPFKLVELSCTVAALLEEGSGGYALKPSESAVDAQLRALGAEQAAGWAPPPPAADAVAAGLAAWSAAGARALGWDLSRLPTAPAPPPGAERDNPYLALYLALAAHAPLRARASAAAVEARCQARSQLCAYLSWSVPTEEALQALAALGPLLEAGAGTGYWAHLLQTRGCDVQAVDLAGSQDGEAARFRHACVRDGCGVAAAAAARGRALLLSWPDEVEEEGQRGFGAACLAAYTGPLVAHVGELAPVVARARRGFGGAAFPPSGCSSSSALQAALRAGFDLQSTIPLPNWPPYNAHLTIWRRRAAAAASLAAAPAEAAEAEAEELAGERLDSSDWFFAPMGTARFLAEALHARPLLLPAGARAGAAPRVFSLAALLARAGEAGAPLRWERDVCASRVPRGGSARESPPLPPGAEAAPGQLRALYDAGYTLQVHQPQRYSQPLWRLCAALEAELGSLVGCNAYVTPPRAQGLAPHWDDVDVFVLHCCGRKAWRVWPTAARQRACSGDLEESELGEPAFSAELGPGDMLYLPRGTAHAAVAGGDACGACHVTLSAHQRWDAGDLALQALRQLLEAPGGEAEACQGALRAPLPPRAASAGAGARGAPPLTELAALVCAALRGAADAIERRPEALMGGLDGLCADLQASRLPPHPAAVPPPGPRPSGQGARVAARAPGSVRVVEEGGRCALQSSLGNAVEAHMMGEGSESGSVDGDDEGEEESVDEEEEEEEEEGEGEEEEEEGPFFPLACAPALRAMLTAEPPEGVKVGQLPLRDAAARLALAQALYDLELISTMT